MTSVPTQTQDDERVGPIRAVLQVLIGVILIVLLALAAAVCVVPRALGGASLIVETGSMQPGIEPGDMVAVRAVEPQDIRTGDIITYATETHLITHRVVGFGTVGQTKTVLTQGDANGNLDEPIAVERVRGKVMYTIPKIGSASIWIYQHLTVIVVVVAVIWGGLFAGEQVRKKRKAAADAAAAQRAADERAEQEAAARKAEITEAVAAAVATLTSHGVIPVPQPAPVGQRPQDLED